MYEESKEARGMTYTCLLYTSGALEAAPNGGTALAQIAQHYLGKAGLLVLAATCLLYTSAWPPWVSAAATAFLTSVIRWAVPMRSSLPAHSI